MIDLWWLIIIDQEDQEDQEGWGVYRWNWGREGGIIS